MKIIFVCTANTCRSPMAEVLLKQALDQRGIRDVEITSAGVNAEDGYPASFNAAQAMQEMSLDLRDHRSRPFGDVDAHDALVLCMTKRHVAAARSMKPQADVRLLGEYAGIDGEVSDPYGGSMEEYRRTARELYGMTEKVAERVVMQNR